MRAGVADIAPGLLIAGVIALASQFVAEHHGAPVMLLALLFGIALNFLGAEGRCRAGIEFGSRHVLRLGVALLGVRISAEMLAELGWLVILLVALGVVGVLAFGFLLARPFGFSRRFAFLASGAVAICGASAAMAIAAILPRDKYAEENLIFTVVGVTLLSTIAMIVYPVLGRAFGFDDWEMGLFIGATVHDVAQVVGAGFSVSEETGNFATLVKLLRVLMLAPVVIGAALVIRAATRDVDGDRPGEKPPLMPGFVLGFILLAGLSVFGAIPAGLGDAASDASRWLLVIAIASVGLKTVPKDVLKVGPASAVYLVLQTVFLAGFVIVGVTAVGALG